MTPHKTGSTTTPDAPRAMAPPARTFVGSPHIAVPSPPHIPLACRAHQSECGRTPPPVATTKEGPSP